MDFKKSKSKVNLARSFAAESQAGLRYQLLVDMCEAQGYMAMANEIKVIAKNEVAHAKAFFTMITDRNGNVDNIDISAGFPFEGTTLENALKFAMEQELAEVKAYTTFAKVATEEKFPEIAERFRLAAQVEKAHATTFRKMHVGIKDGTLYRSPKPIAWECTDCGYTAKGTEPWTVCPLCGAKQGVVQIKC